MTMIKLVALGAAGLLTLSGTVAASAQDTTPFCSKTVTDNCMQREGHAAAPHHAVRHHAPRHHAARHHAARHHGAAAKTAPAPAGKM